MKFRNSRQRNAVLQVLHKKNYHPTVDEIYHKVKREYPKTSLATIYRNVEQLCQMGKIWKIEDPTGPARYDGNVEKHFHIRCKRCGLVRDVWLDNRLEDILDFQTAIEDFSMTGYNIEFEGLCPNCQKSEGN